MASIRKTKKRLKRELRARKVLHGIIDDTLHGVAVKHQSEWLIATTEFELEVLKSRRSFCAFQKRMERKIRKDGKWEEYCELKKRTISQSDFLKDFDPMKHDVLKDENVPTLSIQNAPKGEQVSIPFTNPWGNKD